MREQINFIDLNTCVVLVKYQRISQFYVACGNLSIILFVLACSLPKTFVNIHDINFNHMEYIIKF